MKKLLILFFTFFTLIGIQAQSLGISKVEQQNPETPEEIVKQFKKDYPAFNPIWSREGDHYRADYTDPSTNMAGMVVYNKGGRIVRSETEMQANGYPGSIGDYYSHNLPKATKYKVFAAKDTAGIQSYYTTSEGYTYYFDKDGNYKSRTEPKPLKSEKGKK